MHYLLAGAGWSDAAQRGDARIYISDYTVLLYIILTALFAYWFMQWFAEFLLQPKLSVRQLLILTTFIAGAIALFAYWERILW